MTGLARHKIWRSRYATAVIAWRLALFCSRSMRNFAFRAVLRLAPRIAPLDLEAYMKAHFTKVADQMRGGLRTYLTRGRASGLEVTAIEQLAQRLTA